MRAGLEPKPEKVMQYGDVGSIPKRKAVINDKSQEVDYIAH